MRLALSLLWLVSTPAQAQYTGSFDLVQWGSVDAGHEAAIAESVSETIQSPPLSTQRTNANLGYTVSQKRRQQTLEAMVHRARQSNPARAAELEQFLATPKLFELIGGVLEPLGLTTTNVADAFAIWWIGAWNGARGTNEIVDRATAQAVKRQAEAALLSTPGIADLSDAQKQEMAESYLIQAALIDASIDGAKSDPAMLEQVQRAIAQGAKASGMDLSKVTLTEEGFMPATRTTGANDAGHSATPEAVAARERAAVSPLLYAGAGAGVAALIFWAARGRS